MINTSAINLINPEPMTVTWETGRRCNYDCTYCESTRHNNYSPFHSFEELKKTYEFIKEWTTLYNNSRRDPLENININFTGGEPTMNPIFWDLADHIVNDDSRFHLGLTTNGAWNPKFNKKILERFKGVTVSYHAEGHPNLKKQVLTNIKELSKSDIWLQVNLMLHVDFWDECIGVYEDLKSLEITVRPRPIGDGNISRSGWFIDADGSNRRTSHSYTPEQQEWFWQQTGNKKPGVSQSEGTSLGRACCGGRCLSGKVDNQWKDVVLVDTHFENWLCMVDWYFLHIDQHTGLVYHHQTCKALHDKRRGAIGSLNDSEKMINELKERLKNPNPIVCPNQRCGCGMCAPKAQSQEDFQPIWNSVIKSSSY